MKMGITVYGAHLMVPEEGRTVAKIVRQVANVGFDGIDLGYYWGEDKAAEFAEVKKVADGEGIEIANYIVGNNFGNAALETKESFAAEIAKVKNAIEEAAYFNCHTLRVFGGGYNQPWAEVSPRILEGLAACVETAEKNNVVMALEDHGGNCKNSSEQLFYISEINSPFLRATADIGNFWLPGGELPLVGVSAVAEYVAMVHVKDYVFVNNTPVACPVGEGVIDFKGCFRALKDVNYDGWLSLEYECSIGNPKQGISTSLSNMRKFVACC